MGILAEKLSGLKNRWITIPPDYRRILSMGLLFAILVALPITLWGLQTGRFELRKRAASGELPITHPVNWETATVKLTADDFFISAGGKIFNIVPDAGTTVTVGSDPGDPSYTSLEITWLEKLVEMRLYIYFHSDGVNWWSNEIRTYDGNNPGEWLYYYGNFFNSPLGQGYSQSHFTAKGNRGDLEGILYFNNLNIQAFKNISPTPAPGTCNGLCSINSDCSTNYCYQPVLICPTGMNCPMVMPQMVCRNKDCPESTSCVCSLPLPTPTSTSTPTPTPTSIPVQPIMNFQIKFGGVTSRPANDNDQPVKYYATSLDGGPDLASADNKGMVMVSVDDNGIYHGSITLPNSSYLNHYYRLRLKGPKHLQEIFANVLFTNVGEIDLTGRPLRPGDLNQDGVLDAIDMGLVNDRIFSTDPVDIALVDIDFDGNAWMNDRGLVLNTLSVQYDPE